MKTYFNTKTFDALAAQAGLEVTADPADATLLVLGAKKVDYSQFKILRSVYRFGVGTENIDFELLKKRSITVTFPSEREKKILYDSTANFTVYGILTLLFSNAFGNADTWEKAQRDYIGGRVALVVGTGNIGKRVAAKLTPFVKVETYDVLTNKPHELEPFMRRADIITVHMPLDARTKNFFDREKLAWIKDGAIIVNTARGALFDEDALYDKLRATTCRAFFDVFWEEPYNGKLKGLGSDKFFMTPHSASNTKDFINESFKDILTIAKGLKNA